MIVLVSGGILAGLVFFFVWLPTSSGTGAVRQLDSVGVSNPVPAVALEASSDKTSHKASQPEISAFAVAIRQGRCRNMQQYLANLASAINAEHAAVSIKALGQLAAGMLNDYPKNTQQPSASSRASVEIFTPEGHAEFATLRRNLLTEIRASHKAAAWKKTPGRITQHCNNCHEKYVNNPETLPNLIP